ncbi:hypothetical protein FDG2_0148 [Candidatus Protofrankia californiensis]|uniref:Uncharacterized protein n=1 Tax=Candidatus Protofrankia californiensis TaxID=1839754 RepID=A0A1C3NSZ0_9ACTN|nr:hypothetical protein FDG2_0148 [Candidatus Protofrankia californiensis]
MPGPAGTPGLHRRPMGLVGLSWSRATVVLMGLHLSQIAEADELLTSDPLALLIGMVLDQRGSERTNVAPRTLSDHGYHRPQPALS